MDDPRNANQWPNCQCPAGGSPFAGGSPNGGRRMVSPGRMPSNIDYNTSGSTVTSLDLMRQSPQSARSLDQYGVRAPRMAAQSSAIDSFNLPQHHETFGSQIDYNLSWMPKDVELSDLPEPNRMRGGLPSKYLQQDPNVGLTASSTIDTKYLERSSDAKDSNCVCSHKKKEKPPKSSPTKRSPKHESLLEWFDRTVEKELRKRREGSLNVGENLVNLESPTSPAADRGGCRPCSPVLEQASASNVEIPAKLRFEQDTDLLEAVDKLAKAEAMISFEGAVRAAEEAAANAPPEFAEEAAAAGAEDFQAELTGMVRHEFKGSKPVEVIGYVGITRPKKPKKSVFKGCC